METVKINVTNAKALLSRAEDVYKYNQKLQRISGESFNIFEILQVGHLEVTTHSRFLAEMLDPNGRHSQGATFLNLFIAEVLPEKADLSVFNTSKAKVRVEVTGENGRVDILINSCGQDIVIENKIGAGLQHQQLRRYRKDYPFATLIYLTENEDEPDDSEELRLICISYRNHIIKWLESCRKEVCDVPTIREAITQYIHLLKARANQNTNSIMENEIVESVLSSPASLQAYFFLQKSRDSIRKKIIEEMNERIKSIIPTGYSIKNELEGAGAKYESFMLDTPRLREHEIAFGLHFEGREYSASHFGFCDFSANKGYSPLIPFIRKNFENKFKTPGKTTEWWPAWIDANPTDWKLEEVAFNDALIKDIAEMFQKMQSIAEASIRDLDAAKGESTPSA